MAGNAAEWCLDWYGPYDPANATDPVETRKDRSDKPRRVLRGGSWAREPIRGRSAARYRADPGSRNADTGFRVVAATGATAPSTAAPQTAASAVESSNDSQGMTVILWILGAALAVMVGIAALARRMMSGAFGNSHGVRTSVSDDGFSIHAPKVPSGHRIHYVYVVDGAPKTGDVIFAGESDQGQMIYTGARPALVQILAVTAPGETFTKSVVSGQPAMSDTSYTSSASSTASSSHDSFRGYPSAY